jgi:hypothetical protein
VSGRVAALESRRPIASARVVLTFDVPEEALEDTGWTHVVESGTDGAFRFDGLPRAPFRIRAAAPGRLQAEERSVLPGEEVEILLAVDRGLPCRLQVRNGPDSEPLPLRSVHFDIRAQGWQLATKSDASGDFAITGVEPRKLVEAWREDALWIIVPGCVDPVLAFSSLKEPESAVLTVERGEAVSGRVIDGTSGRPIAGASVASDSGEAVTTDANGIYRLPAVLDTLSARAPGYAVRIHEIEEAGTPGSGPVAAGERLLDIRLDRGLTLHGRVLSPGSQPLPGVRVGLQRDIFSVALDSEFLARVLVAELAAVSDAEGRYRIDGLPPEELGLPGTVDLDVRPPSAQRGVLHEAEVDAEEGEYEHDIVLNLERGLSGTVRSRDGQPAAAATVAVESLDDENFELRVTDEGGNFAFAGLPHGMYDLSVLSGDKPLLVQAVGVPTEPLDLRLPPLQSVDGNVVRESNSEPVRGLTARLLFTRGALRVGRDGAIDDSGRFHFDDVPPGVFTLLLRQAEGRRDYEPLNPFHQEKLTVESRPWRGELRYPERPSGWVNLTFAVALEDGAVRPAVNERVEVDVVGYRRPAGSALVRTRSQGRLPAAMPLRRTSPTPLGAAEGSFRKELREGDYIFRCRSQAESLDLSAEETVLVAAGATVERQVVLKRRPSK